MRTLTTTRPALHWFAAFLFLYERLVYEDVLLIAGRYSREQRRRGLDYRRRIPINVVEHLGYQERGGR